MGNPLQSAVPPQPPDIPQGAQQAGQPPSPLQGQPQQPPPTLSHQEAVAALRHFHAIQGELETLLKNPGLGKSDIKSSIIDGVTKLVSSQIMTPAVAVSQLATVPAGPKDQRKWLEQHYQQTMQAQTAVLDHHRAAGPGTQDWDVEGQAQPGASDNHIETMTGIMDRYKGPSRG